jgi:elongation factor P
MLNYNQIKERKYIVLNGEPYEVLNSQVSRKQASKPVNQTKLRNLITGSVRSHTFHNSDKAEEADISKEKYVFSFSKFNRQTKSEEFWFYKDGDKSKRVSIDKNIIEDKIKFLKSDTKIDALIFDENIIGISLPIKMQFKIKSAPPAVKGNTATGANKQITLETGLIITAPIFVSEKDDVIVNTETGEYVERAKAAS